MHPYRVPYFCKGLFNVSPCNYNKYILEVIYGDGIDNISILEVTYGGQGNPDKVNCG